MVKYYVDNLGNFVGGFDGNNPPNGAIEVLDAPVDARSKWVGGKWVLPEPTKEEINKKVVDELVLIDAATIRAMREYIASKADAPQILIDRETLAAQLRAKLK
jgi:hypothetical protein